MNTLTISLITLLVSAIVFVVQQQVRYTQFFHECTKALHSENQIEQSAAAILLRSFLSRQWWSVLIRPNFSKEAKNLMVILLRQQLPSELQKTIGDGFSFANNLDGQDMQNICMFDCLIKPQSRIKFEVTKNPKYKEKRISMKNADFFHATLQGCSINNVNANGGIFLNTILCGTSFRNCILENANFENANLKGVRFDEDCNLESARFKGAIGLDDAAVKNKQGESKKLIDFLDQNGVFHYDNLGSQYTEIQPKINIFVSKLGAMDSSQKLHYDSIFRILQSIDGVSLNTIDRVNYPAAAQLTDVSNHLDKSDGCIVFAFEYLEVTSGCIHKNVIGNERKIIQDKIFTSPWLQIETAIANVKQKPCLIIYDKDLYRDGMFDDSIINTADKNLLSLPYSDLISKSNSTLQEWISIVRDYHLRH